MYSSRAPLNHRTLNVPVRGLTLRVQTLRETLGETGEMLIMCRCCCVYCTMGETPSGKQQVSDAINNLTVLHHGVTQPVLHPSVGTRLVMHGVADICCPIQTGDVLPLMEGRAGDEVGSSGHDVLCVVHATIIGTGSDGLLASVCHLSNWLGRPTSLCYLRT